MRSRSFVSDGPPLLLVAMIFAGLLAFWPAPGASDLMAALLGVAMLLTSALEFRRRAKLAITERQSGGPHATPLRQRLDEASPARRPNRWL